MFELPIVVDSSHIDDLGHVNNVVYLQWVQDVARSHWHAMANADDIKNLGWVVTRHEMEYRAAGFLGDELVARTWIGETTPLTCERFVEIRRRNDGRVLMQARSIWIPVDRGSGRPRRIGPQVLAPFREPPSL